MNVKYTRFAALSVLCALIVSMLSGCYFLPTEEPLLEPPLQEAKEVTYDTYTVTTGNIEYWLDIQGHFQTPETITLSFGDTVGKLGKIYVKVGDEVKAGDLLAELESEDLDRQIYRQRASVRLAELSLKDAKKSSSATAIERAEIQLDLAQYELDHMLAQREANMLYAPMDATVIYAADNTPGDFISKELPMIHLADTSQLLITAKTKETSALYHGMELDVVFNRTGGEVVKGRVFQLPGDNPEGNVADSINVVKISIDTFPKDARIGTTVNVRTLLEHAENVVVIPYKYVSSYGARNYVRVLNEDGVPEERTIVIGIDNKEMVEIVNGLEAGDQIII